MECWWIWNAGGKLLLQMECWWMLPLIKKETHPLRLLIWRVPPHLGLIAVGPLAIAQLAD